MRRLFLRWLLLALSIVGASLICQAVGLAFQADFRSVESVVKLLVGAVVLALLNATLGKILKVLTLPLSCITLGLFSLVVNALVLWFAASFELGFRITADGFQGFLASFVASVLISIINGVLGMFLPDDEKEE